MCEFKPGDEVVCVRAADPRPGRRWVGTIVVGETYIVESVAPVPEPHPDAGLISVRIVGAPNFSLRFGGEVGYHPSRFRKVERRNDRLSIEAFLTIKPGFEEPRRPKAPAKKRERA